MKKQIVMSVPLQSFVAAEAADEHANGDGLLLTFESPLAEVNGLESQLVATGHEYAQLCDQYAAALERIQELETAIRRYLQLPIGLRRIGLYQVVNEPLPPRFENVSIFPERGE